MKSTRWIEITPSEHAWEREALDYLKARLPDGEPFRAWSNFEFIAEDGSINEVDLLVVSLHKVYLVEIKSWSGSVSGDASTWRREIDGKELLVDSPLLLANRKAKKLVGLLKAQKALARQRRPYVEAVVFLSRGGVRCRLEGRARTGVYLPARSERDPCPGILDVLRGDAGFDPRRPPPRIDRSLSRAFARAMEQAGIHPSQRQRRVADYVLRKLLLETDDYQDWEAEHVSVPSSKRRVRIYPLSAASSGAMRTERRRAAEPPLLFHKAELTDGAAEGLAAPVREALRDQRRRVVGAVLNAVDDHLAKSGQMQLAWRFDSVRLLPALLMEAHAAGRAVVLTSDHGHVLEAGGVKLPGDGEGRWRSAAASATAREIEIGGARVRAATGLERIVLPWSETVRYGSKRNGYHGGVSLQEAVAPVGVYVGPGETLAGWEPAPASYPPWWFAEEPAPLT